jgi:hypothetical protein
MNILILDQRFATEGDDVATRLFQIGRRLASCGNKVTVISGNSKLDLPLGGKKIGLLQKDGLAIIVLNIPYEQKMRFMEKCFALFRYFKRANGQGQKLPRPDIIIAASPPLTNAYAAVLLSRRYEAPLILQIGELWPEALIRRGALNNKYLIALACRLEKTIYSGTAAIIAGALVAADTIRETTTPGRPVHILSEDLPGEVYAGRFQEIIFGVIGAGRE